MRQADVVNYFVEQVGNGCRWRPEDLRAVAKDGSHQPRIPAPVKNRDDPKRLLVWCIGDEVLVARDMEAQRASGQVRTSVAEPCCRR
jgi:hypothetical protein